MDQRRIDIGRCFSDGYAAFRANMGPAILGFLLSGLIGLILPRIPFLPLVFAIFLAGPFEGGYAILSLNLVRNENPSVGDIFGGFRTYGKFLGAHWLQMVLAFGVTFVFTFIPLNMIYRRISSALLMSGVRTTGTIDLSMLGINLPLIIGLLVLNVIFLTILMIRWGFVFFVIADEPEKYSVLEAFGRSAELTRGNRMAIFVMGFLAGLLTAAGALLFLVGLLAAIPIASCVFASAYVQLTAPERESREHEYSPSPSGTTPDYAHPSQAPPPPSPSTWLLPPESEEASIPPESGLGGQTYTAPPPAPEPAAARLINLTPSLLPSMEPLRIDQSMVGFALRDRSSLLANETPVVSLAISADGSLVAAAGQDGTIKLWDRYRRALLAVIELGPLPADSVAVSPDRQTILAGCRDPESGKAFIRVFTAAGTEKTRFDEPHAMPVSGLAFSPQGDKAAAISWDGSVKILDLATGAVILTGTHPQRGLAVAFTFDGSHVVSASQDWTLTVWQVSTASVVATHSAKNPGSYQAVLSAGGEWLAVRDENGWANLVEVKSLRDVASWTTAGKICALHASAEGSVVVWEAQGNSLLPRHVQGNRTLPELAAHTQEVDCVAVSPDGMCVVSGGKDGMLAIWEAV